jgi:hypothetical protein
MRFLVQGHSPASNSIIVEISFSPLPCAASRR